MQSDHHPDKGGDAAALAHINVLYDEAERLRPNDIWERKDIVQIMDTSGRQFELEYYDAFDFELGRTYVGEQSVVYVVREEFGALYENGVKTLKSIHFDNSEAKDNHERYLPKITFDLRTTMARLLVVSKPSSFYRLKTVVDAIQPFDPRHVAWVTNWAYDLTCGLAHLQHLIHPDISMDTVFINPADHIAMLAGGWWYAAPRGGKLNYAPQRSVRHGMPVPAASASAVYPFLIRLLAREMLGDANGSKLLMRSDIPAPLLRWARTEKRVEIIKDFTDFHKDVIPQAFGKRKFVVLDYPPKETP